MTTNTTKPNAPQAGKIAEEKAALEQAALKQAEKLAAMEAKWAALTKQITDAISTMLKSESEALQEVVIAIRALPTNKLETIKVPAKLASKTSGKVITYALTNNDKFHKLCLRVIDGNTGKELSDTALATKVIAIIKAHFVVKPYSDLF